MTPEHEQWMNALDEIRAHLDDLRRAVAAGDVSDVPAFEVPNGLPPLPLSCAEHARVVAREQSELQDELRRQLAEIPLPNRATRRPRPDTRAATPRFERRA